MKHNRRMTIKINYQDYRFGNVYVTSPRGGRNRLMWRIGSAILLFGGWLMFGKHGQWITETSMFDREDGDGDG